MKIKEQTRKLAAGCSKHCFEVVDKTDEVNHIYGKATLTWFEFDFRRVLNLVLLDSLLLSIYSKKRRKNLRIISGLVIKSFSQY